MTAATVDWWYVRAYPGSADALDAATRLLLPWLRDRAREAGARRWFFIRYLDMTGHHLRLRVAAAPAALDRLHGRRAELAALVGELAPAAPAGRLVPGAMLPTMTESRGVRADLYAPELDKYGGRPGVALAEGLFTRASDWYVDADVAGLPLLYERSALARDYLGRLVAAALPEEPDRLAFRALHRQFWGRHLRAAVPDRAALAERLGRARAGTDAAAVGIDVAERVRDVVGTLDAAAAAGLPVPRAHLLLHYLHMDLNRWGFPPAEECLLGLAAGSAA